MDMPIHHVWCAHPNEMAKHACSKRLKGRKWKTPTIKNADSIKDIIQHDEDPDDQTKHIRHNVLWDNGFVDQTDAQNAAADAPDVVSDCTSRILPQDDIQQQQN